MMRHPVNWLRLILLCLLMPVLVPAADEAERRADERLLKEQGIGPGGDALLKFLRLRSPTGDDRPEINRLLAALGSDSFEERENATQLLIQRGSSIAADLKKLADHPDAEVRRRAAEALAEIEHGPGPALPVAVIRQLVLQAPAGTAAALLRYVPFADDESIEDAIIAGLERLHQGKPLSPALLDGLRSPAAAIRGVAGRIVGEHGTIEQRDRAAALLRDGDPNVRFRTAVGLLTGGQRVAATTLIDLLLENPPLCWQAEAILYRLAGEKGPGVTTSLVELAGRRKSREVWTAWWREHGSAVDLARLGDPRQLGLTLGIEYNTGRIWEARPDRSLRFELKGLQGPMEAQLLANGRILVAESNARQVTERDLQGNVIWRLDLNGQDPTGCQRLANGNTFVSTYGRVMEFARDGKSVYSFDLPQGSNAIHKARNGNILFATTENIIELTTTGQQVRQIPLPRENMWVGLLDLPGDRFLAANSSSGRVVEIDRAGKIVWEARVAGACGVERTATGHTLVATSNRVVELDRAGNTVWELKTPGYVRRVHRR